MTSEERRELHERLPDPGQFPHCDQSVLHSPGECTFCDGHSDWQALRLAWGIAFTGHAPRPLYDDGPFEVACPSDQRRGVGKAHVWGGNRPTNVPASELPSQTLASRITYGDPVVSLGSDDDEDGVSRA